MTDQYVLFRGFYSTLPINWAEMKALVGTEVWHRLIDGDAVVFDNGTAAALKAKLPPATLYSVEQAQVAAPRLFLGADDGALFTHSRTCGYEVFIPPVPRVGNFAVHVVTSDDRLWHSGQASVYLPLNDEGLPFDLIARDDQVDAAIKSFFDSGEQLFPAIEATFQTTPLPFYEEEWGILVERVKLTSSQPIARYWRAHVVRRARQIAELLQTEGSKAFEYADDPEIGHVRFLHALKYERVFTQGVRNG